MVESAVDPIIIVGASVGGAAMVRSLRAHGYEGPLVLVGAETELPYDRPPLSKGILTGDVEESSLSLLSAEDCATFNVTLELGVQATGLNVADRELALSDGRTLRYAELIISTGVNARELQLEGERQFGHTLRTIADAEAIRTELGRSASIAIIGAGFIGLEVASSARAMGIDVNIIEPAPMPMFRRVPEYVSTFMQRVHEGHGVQFHFGRLPAKWQSENGTLTGVVLDDNTVIPADFCLVGIGGSPNVQWLEGSGLEIADGVLCNENNLAAEHVYAIGDVAAVLNRAGKHQRVEHRMTASAHAERVACAILGIDLPTHELPYFWSDQYDVKLQMHGKSPIDAEFELVDEDTDAGKFVGVIRSEGEVVGVIGAKSAGRLTRMRRELLLV